MLISIIFFVLTIYPSFALNKDCIVKDYYKKENWNGEELTFYSYVPKNDSVQIKITYEDLSELDFDTTIILSPSSNYSQIYEKKNGKYLPSHLPTMNTSNEWIKFKVSANNGIIEVACEPNTNESVPINQASHTVKDLSIKAMYISLCKEESPTWEITEGIHNKIPLSGKENVNIAIESFEEFSPILHIMGNSVSFSWKKESIAISKGPSLPKGKYFISIFNQSDQIVLTLYSDKFESGVSLTNIGGHLDSLEISTSNGKFYSILNLDDSTNYYRCEEMNTENGDAVLSLTNFREPCQELGIPLICITVYAILTVLIVYFLKNKRITILKPKTDLEQQEPLINSKDHESRCKVNIKGKTEMYVPQSEPETKLMPTYKLIMNKDHIDPDKKVQKLSLGPIDKSVPTKSILLLGETGSGKSTTVNAMINYIFGIKFEDEERVLLVGNDTERNLNEYESQTEYMSAYVLPYQTGMPNCCNYIIIDTPGFGDTRGFERDQKIMLQVENFLKQDYEISHIDIVGFVVSSTVARLTIAQRYIYDGLFSMFGKDIKHNIFLITTFAEENDPLVLKVLEKAEIQYHDYFKLDNDSLYRPNKDDRIDEENSINLEMIKSNWKRSEDSLQKFFHKLPRVNPVSLSLTKIVLEENTRLRSVVGYLQKQIKEGLDKISQLNERHIGSNNPEAARHIRQEIRTAEEHLVIAIKDAQQLTARLKDIPLRLDPLSVHGYIEGLIKNEQEERNINYEDRILVLEKLKEENEILKAVIGKESPPGEGWLHYFQKFKED